jgi:hypothetical protein
MPFSPSNTLIQYELTIRKFFLILEKNDASPLYTPFDSLCVAVAEEVIDEDNILLIEFYKTILNFINTSIEIKKQASAPQIIQNQMLADLLQLFYQIGRRWQLINETENPDLVHYFISRPTGRFTIYYLLLVFTIHMKQWNTDHIIQLMAQILKMTKLDDDENIVLDYILYLTLPAVGREFNHTNPFISLHHIIILPDCQIFNPLKMKQIEKIANNYPNLSKHVPQFFQNFLKNNFLNLSLLWIAQNPSLVEHADNVIKLLQQNHFLPNLNPAFKKYPTLSHIIFLGIRMFKFHMVNALFHDRNQLLYQWYFNLTKLQIDYYQPHKHHFTEPSMNYFLSDSLTILLSTHQTPKKDSEIKDFCTKLKVIFTLSSNIDQNYIINFVKHIDIIISYLYAHKENIAAIQVLEQFLTQVPHQSDYCTEATYSNYKELLLLMKFCEFHTDEKSQQFTEFMQKINKSKLKFQHLSKSFIDSLPKLFELLKNQFIEKIIFFSENIEHISKDPLCHKLQNVVFSLCTILQAKSEEIERLEQIFCFDQDFLVEDSKATMSTSSSVELDDEKETSAPAKPENLTSQSIFKSANGGKEFVSSQLLPKAFLAFAQDIRQQFNQDVILTGSSVAHLYLKKPLNSDFDCLLFDVPIEQLFSFLESKSYLECKRISRNYPILRLKIQSEAQPIEVDISCKVKHEDALLKAIEMELSQRDFKIASLFMVMNNQPVLEIKGFGKSLHSINHKKISIVHHDDQIFYEDPTRILRLIKILHQYPDFELDDQLKLTLKKTNFKECLQNFLQTTTNQARLSTSFENLFARFPVKSVLMKFEHLGIFEEFFEIDINMVQQTLSLMKLDELEDAYCIKLHFFLFLHVHYCLQAQSIDALHQYSLYPLHKITRHADKINFNHIEHHILKEEAIGLVNSPLLNKLIEELRVYYDKKPTIPASTNKL